MLRLRRPLCPTVSTAGAFRVVVASAGVAVILSAICAMMVPRPTMNAARIIMLRITPHSIRGTCNITTSAARPRLTAAAKAAILTKRMSEVLTGTSLPLPVLYGERSDCEAIRVSEAVRSLLSLEFAGRRAPLTPALSPRERGERATCAGGYLLTFERRHRRNQRLFSLKILREIANRGRHHGTAGIDQR